MNKKAQRIDELTNELMRSMKRKYATNEIERTKSVNPQREAIEKALNIHFNANGNRFVNHEENLRVTNTNKYILDSRMASITIEMIIETNREFIKEIEVYWDGDYFSTAEPVDIDSQIIIETIGGISSSGWSLPMINILDIFGNEITYNLPYFNVKKQRLFNGGSILEFISETIQDNYNKAGFPNAYWGDF